MFTDSWDFVRLADPLTTYAAIGFVAYLVAMFVLAGRRQWLALGISAAMTLIFGASAFFSGARDAAASNNQTPDSWGMAWASISPAAAAVGCFILAFVRRLLKRRFDAAFGLLTLTFFCASAVSLLAYTWYLVNSGLGFDNSTVVLAYNAANVATWATVGATVIFIVCALVRAGRNFSGGELLVRLISLNFSKAPGTPKGNQHEQHRLPDTPELRRVV